MAVFRKTNPVHLRFRLIGGILAFASEPCIVKDSFRSAKLEIMHSKAYIGLTELELPDEHGYIFNLNDSSSSTVSQGEQWIKKMEPFKLSNNAY